MLKLVGAYTPIKIRMLSTLILEHVHPSDKACDRCYRDFEKIVNINKKLYTV